MLCQIYRWMLSRSLDAEAPVSPRLRRHLKSCDACRRYYENLSILADRLRAELPGQPALRSDLRERIFQAVRSEPTRLGPARHLHLKPALNSLAAAACVLLAIGLFFGRRSAQPVQPQPSANGSFSTGVA